MAFTIIIGLLFLGIVFGHYLQGFFSATLSAIVAVLAAVLAFSWHETIVEALLKGKAANVAHAMVLVALFAAIYLIFRVIVDKAVPDGVTLPSAIDRLGGALMGMVAAAFTLGIVSIAAQEMPFGAAVAGYTKYDSSDTDAQIIGGASSQRQTGSNFNELKSNMAGGFDEADRKQMFPLMPLGVDEILVNLVAHLSSTGSLQASHPLTEVHPDFLQETFAQRIGIQGGAQHVTMNLSEEKEGNKAISIVGLYSLPEAARDGLPANEPAQVRLVDGQASGARTMGVAPALKLAGKPGDNLSDKSAVYQKSGVNELKEKVQYELPASKHMALVVVRITFGTDAAEHSYIRISPGSIRLVAQAAGKSGAEPHDYYPIGTLEPGSPYPLLYVDKPDDFLFISSNTPAGRPGMDAVFLVDKDLVLSKDQKKIIDPNAFIEVKRLFREELANKELKTWTPADPKEMTIGVMHQEKRRDIVSGNTARFSTDTTKH